MSTVRARINKKYDLIIRTSCVLRGFLFDVSGLIDPLVGMSCYFSKVMKKLTAGLADESENIRVTSTTITTVIVPQRKLDV